MSAVHKAGLYVLAASFIVWAITPKHNYVPEKPIYLSENIATTQDIRDTCMSVAIHVTEQKTKDGFMVTPSECERRDLGKAKMDLEFQVGMMKMRENNAAMRAARGEQEKKNALVIVVPVKEH